MPTLRASEPKYGVHTSPFRNDHGIRSGYCRDVDIIRLLRENRGKAKAILYIARIVGEER